MNWQTVITDIKSGLGITQAQLAKRIGIAQASVSDIERGIVKDPRYTTGNALMELHRKAARNRGAARPQHKTNEATQSPSPASSAPV